MEQSIIGSALLGDDMSLGKIIVALLLVELSGQKSNSPPFRPTLILFPSNAAAVWKSEIAKHFSHFLTRFFMGSIDGATPAERERTQGTNTDHLVSFVRELDPSEEKPQKPSSLALTLYGSGYPYRLNFGD